MPLLGRFYSVVSCLCCLCLIGCAARSRNAQFDKHNTYLSIIEVELQPDKVPVDWCASNKNWYEQYQCELNASTPDPAKLARDRNRIIDEFTHLADVDYLKFEDKYNSQQSLISTVGDFTGLALTGAGSVLSVAKELSAAATGVKGAQSSYEKNYNDTQTRFVITLKMEALRKDVLTQIKAGELLPALCPAPSTTTSSNQQATCYTLQQGMIDLGQYFSAGTVHRALAEINNTTAGQSKTADDKLQLLNHSQTTLNDLSNQQRQQQQQQ